MFCFSKILLLLNVSYVCEERCFRENVYEWMKNWMILFWVRWTLISEMFRRLLYLLKAVISGSMKCCSPSSSVQLQTWVSSRCSLFLWVKCHSSVLCSASMSDSLHPKECISISHTVADWRAWPSYPWSCTTQEHVIWFGSSLPSSLHSVLYCWVTWHFFLQKGKPPYSYLGLSGTL